MKPTVGANSVRWSDDGDHTGVYKYRVTHNSMVTPVNSAEPCLCSATHLLNRRQGEF